MKDSTKNKLKRLLGILFINILFALVYMRVLPIFYQYLHNQYSSVGEVLLLAVSLLLVWPLGALISVLFTCDLLINPAGWLNADGLLYFSLFGFAIILSVYLLVRGKKINKPLKEGLFLANTMAYNFVFLFAFFSSMSV